jgi:hypothetical protein
MSVSLWLRRLVMGVAVGGVLLAGGSVGSGFQRRCRRLSVLSRM